MMATTADQAMMAGVAPGFDRLLLREAPSLTRYARRLARSLADAEDLLQDTLLRCWKARTSFEAGTNFGGWTRAVMRNAFFNGLRRQRLEIDLPDDTLLRTGSLPPTQGIALELREALRALDRLPDGHRRAVIMTIDGVPMEEGAARLAVPLNTYKSWVHRGRTRLTRMLDGDAPDRIPDTRPRPRPRDEKPAPQRVVRSKRDWSGVMIG